MLTCSVNGIDLSPYLTVEDVHGRGPMGQEANTFTVPGRDGSYFVSKRRPDRMLEVEFHLKGTSLADVRQKVDILSGLLEMGKPSPIVFSDEPTMTYYGILYGTPAWQEIVYIGKGKINFLCPDPFKYGITRTVPFTGSAATIDYEGTAKTFPVYKVTFTQPTTFFSLVTPTESLVLGQPQTVDKVTTQQYVRVLTDDMSSLTNWVNGAVVDNGIVAGTMIANKFRASAYGTDNAWHGPAKKRSLPTPIQDFRVQAYISQKSTSHLEVGRVEIYLLDVNSNIIGKMLLRDSTTGYKYNWAQARAGNEADNHVLYDGYGNMAGTWNDFNNGIIEIKRTGKVWEFHIAKRDANGKEYARLDRRWRHTTTKYEAPLAQVQVHIGAYGAHAATTQSVNTIYVDQIVSPGSNEIPLIAATGDVFEIDSNTKKILKNGAELTNVRDPRSAFFPLVPGENIISAFPPDIAAIELTYPERWL